jgi:hypothetical protein
MNANAPKNLAHCVVAAARKTGGLLNCARKEWVDEAKADLGPLFARLLHIRELHLQESLELVRHHVLGDGIDVRQRLLSTLKRVKRL